MYVMHLGDALHEHEEENGRSIAQGNDMLSKAQNSPKFWLVLPRKWSGSRCSASGAYCASWDNLVAPLSAYFLWCWSCYGKDRSLPGVHCGPGSRFSSRSYCCSNMFSNSGAWEGCIYLMKAKCLLDFSFQLSFRGQFKSEKVLHFLLFKK